MSELANGCNFEYDGRNANELHLKIGHDDGLFERSFGMTREINTEKIRGIDTPYYYGNDREVLSGTMRICCDIPWTLKQERDVAEFLFKERFCEFISEDNQDLVYQLMFTDDASILTGMGNLGYIDLNFTCDAPWAWSKPFEAYYNLTYKDMQLGFEFDFDNISNVTDYNAMEIQMELPETLTQGDKIKIKIQNLRTQGSDEAFCIAGTKRHPLLPSEKIYINMREETVSSDKDMYRSATAGQGFIPVDRGHNWMKISIEGVEINPFGNDDTAVLFNVRSKFPILR